MNELQEKITLATSDKEARYFYHLTPQSGDKILDEGLIVANPEWEMSFLEFTEKELENIESVIEDNRSNKIKQNNTLLIVGVYDEDVQNFIKPLGSEEAYDINWEGVGNPNYIVHNNFIVGYIDLNSLEFVYNDLSYVWTGFYDL